MFDDPRDETLSPAEQSAFDALPREVRAPPSLEERTVALLRAHGQLPIPLGRARAVSGVLEHTRVLWIAGAIAASLALFASGVALGQYLGARSVADIASRGLSAADAAEHIQRAGSLYVAALASLGALPDSTDPEARETARQAALTVLGTAAEEVVHLAPNDPLAAAVLRGLEQRGRLQRPAPPSRSVVWF